MSTVSSTGTTSGTLPGQTWTWATPTPATSSTSGASSSSSSANAVTQAAGGAMGKDQFVQLLVTEMQNQDPMNPMDGKDLAAQLAQFSSVEQLINVNTKLDDLTSAVKAANSATGGTTPASSSTGNASSTTGTGSTSTNSSTSNS